MIRHDGRKPDELRKWSIFRGVLDHAEGSALIEAGKTKVLCAASVDKTVPMFLKDKGQGWVTGEYSMLPRSTHTRSPRERNRVGGRTLEIQRMIGRSLRSIIDLKGLGERTITVDCDVLQADGGTRTAAITGAYVAVALSLKKMIADKTASPRALKTQVAAVSVGIVGGEEMLDLDYSEDSRAEVDFNIVMTSEGKFIEVQGTAEGEPFARDAMDRLVNLARDGIAELFKIQVAVLAG